MTSLSFNDWFLDTNSRATTTIATTTYTSITSMDALEAIYSSLPDMSNNNTQKNPHLVFSEKSQSGVKSSENNLKNYLFCHVGWLWLFDKEKTQNEN